MEKYVVRLYDYKGKRVKQKTFMADGWDKAEEMEYKLCWEFEAKFGFLPDSSLSVIK